MVFATAEREGGGGDVPAPPRPWGMWREEEEERRRVSALESGSAGGCGCGCRERVRERTLLSIVAVGRLRRTGGEVGGGRWIGSLRLAVSMVLDRQAAVCRGFGFTSAGCRCGCRQSPWE